MPRVGLGHDTHRLALDCPLILGGVRIQHDRGLVGHSDADVVCHALVDAILGAAGLGDIGELFPDTDPRWQGADSTLLLRDVAERVRKLGYSLVNCDLVIHAQAPRLTPYKARIRSRLAEVLEIEESRVNVKAKTGEQVGPVGRGESIVCHAVVLLDDSSPA